MATTIVTINRHIIRKNKKEGRNDPPIRVSNGKYGKPEYVSEFNIPVFDFSIATLKYEPNNPLPCGATVWLELE